MILRICNVKYCFGAFVGAVVVVAICTVMLLKTTSELTRLKQVHIIFPNGERTPTKEEILLFPLSIHQNETFYPFGFNALTNIGKQSMFEMGKKIRNMYESFLQKTYKGYEFTMQTAETDLSKMSALAVLAGLWPIKSNETWGPLAWQPIPYMNLPINKDYMMYEKNCPRYIQEKERVTSLYMEKEFKAYGEILRDVSFFTGYNITTPYDVMLLKNLFNYHISLKKTYSEWLKDMKESINEIFQVEYKLMFYNGLLKKLSAGPILRKIMDDFKQEINTDGDDKNGKKMYLYSGMPSNVISILATLSEKAFTYKNNVLILELHYYPILNDYGVKLLKTTNTFDEIMTVKMLNCTEICPIKFLEDREINILNVKFEEDCRLYDNIVIHNMGSID